VTDAEPAAPTSNVEVATGLLQAYRRQDRARAEQLIDGALTFTSPQDDHIDRSAYFARCFPTADRFSEQRLLHAMDLDADHVVLAYEYALQTGERYRNTEILAVHDGKVTEIQVFFGGAVR
jgi:ketosteroid isomerase-like protein